MLTPEQIRQEITPVQLQEPTVEQIVTQARAKGMTVGGNFPLASGTRYIVAFFDANSTITPSGLETEFESLDGINNAFYVGEHTTGPNLPGKQWEVNLKIKVRETNIPTEIIIDEEV
jgi:hypothetical protein